MREIIVEPEEKLFIRFTSNVPHRTSFWQKIHMKPTLQKTPGFKDEVETCHCEVTKTDQWRSYISSAIYHTVLVRSLL